MIRALIFDFDGTILDTETPALESWRAIYADHGHELPLDEWHTTLGRSGGEGFDALTHLASLVGAPFDAEAARARRQAHKHELCEALSILPGIADLLHDADAMGLPCAVASSSGRDWVAGWLERHGLARRFRCVRTADDVAHTKPAPDLFLSAAACLGVEPAHCLVIEDSPNGILAAGAAGMRCVAVPCALTAPLALPPADLVLPSLAGWRLPALLERLGTSAAPLPR
jgi:HAD superfamily hydrolase (TIGR01509 family)